MFLGIAFLATAFTAYAACLTSGCIVPVTSQHIDMETLIVGGFEGLVFFGSGVALFLSGRRTSMRGNSILGIAFIILGVISIPLFGMGVVFLIIGGAIRWGGNRDRALVVAFLLVLLIVTLATSAVPLLNGLTLYQIWNSDAIAQSVGLLSGTFLWVIMLILFSGLISMGSVVYLTEPRMSRSAASDFKDRNTFRTEQRSVGSTRLEHRYVGTAPGEYYDAWGKVTHRAAAFMCSCGRAFPNSDQLGAHIARANRP
jgi:hypothetical protein